MDSQRINVSISSQVGIFIVSSTNSSNWVCFRGMNWRESNWKYVSVSLLSHFLFFRGTLFYFVKSVYIWIIHAHTKLMSSIFHNGFQWLSVKCFKNTIIWNIKDTPTVSKPINTKRPVNSPFTILICLQVSLFIFLSYYISTFVMTPILKERSGWHASFLYNLFPCQP